jgi:hypothetical protein
MLFELNKPYDMTEPVINSLALVRERTIPTEQPLPVGEVRANFCGQRVPRGLHDESLRPYSGISRPGASYYFKKYENYLYITV